MGNLFNLIISCIKHIYGTRKLEIYIKNILLDYLEGAEKLNEMKNAINDEDFIYWRTKESVIGQMLYFFAFDCYLEDDIYLDENFKQFNMNCATFCTIINDIYSIKKEIYQNSADRNYFYFMMKSQQMTAGETLSFMMNKLNNILVDVDFYGYKIKSSYNCSEYVDVCQDHLKRMIRFHSTSDRYNKY